MRIIATVRARNEQASIGRFCMSYAMAADEILVADGGSTDQTVNIANRQPRTSVLSFNETMALKGGHEINPQGKHVNFLIAHAKARGADWIIFDDCDCVPNRKLRNDIRTVIETADGQGKIAVFTRRVFMSGQDFHYPLLHKPNTSLWAFRVDSGVHADEDDPLHLTMLWERKTSLHSLRERALHLEFPYCLLHFTWPNEEEINRKLAFYRESGVQPNAMHPKAFGGERKPIEDFMKHRLYFRD